MFREKLHRCQERGQSCLCGWSRDMNGAAIVKSTGQHAGVISPIKGRKKNKGARVGRGTRLHLLKIPCYFCGGKAESVDHFISRAKGGMSDRDNLVSACLVCNGMKGDKSYDELLSFCRQMETAENRRTALRYVRTFLQWKEQAKKILAWHEKRIASKQLPVV